MLALRVGAKVTQSDRVEEFSCLDQSENILIVPCCDKRKINGDCLSCFSALLNSSSFFPSAVPTCSLKETLSSFSRLLPSSSQGTSDFCVSPDKFLLSQTKGLVGTGQFLAPTSTLGCSSN